MKFKDNYEWRLKQYEKMANEKWDKIRLEIMLNKEMKNCRYCGVEIKEGYMCQECHDVE